ncbi:MAG: hypothetical protein ACYCWW_02500 [Deltaproteobacteria bacterium]
MPVNRVQSISDSTGNPAHSIAFTYGLNSGNSGLESLSSVTVQNGYGSSAYNYYYDAFQRRRLKAYPTAGGTDEYFYDLGHQQFMTTRTNELASPPPTCSRQGDDLPATTPLREN